MLGFGSTEEKLEKEIEKSIRDYVAEAAHNRDSQYFDEAIIGDVTGWIKDRANESQAEGEKWKTAESPPERYSYFWCHVLADSSAIVFILTVHHISRRHALSPDGWGMMRTEPVVVVKASES